MLLVNHPSVAKLLVCHVYAITFLMFIIVQCQHYGYHYEHLVICVENPKMHCLCIWLCFEFRSVRLSLDVSL